MSEPTLLTCGLCGEKSREVHKVAECFAVQKARAEKAEAEMVLVRLGDWPGRLAAAEAQAKALACKLEQAEGERDEARRVLLDATQSHDCAGQGECWCDDAWPMFGLGWGDIPGARRALRALAPAPERAPVDSEGDEADDECAFCHESLRIDNRARCNMHAPERAPTPTREEGPEPDAEMACLLDAFAPDMVDAPLFAALRQHRSTPGTEFDDVLRDLEKVVARLRQRSRRALASPPADGAREAGEYDIRRDRPESEGGPHRGE